MKTSTYLLFMASMLVFTSCEKSVFEKSSKNKFDDYKNCAVCQDQSYEALDQVASGVTKYIVEPIITSEDCDCIVSGLVKYVKNNQTVALVKYGDGDCDGYAYKITCIKGDCKDKKSKICKFKQDCGTKPL